MPADAGMDASNPAGYICSLCGQSIASTQLDPCSLLLTTQIDRARSAQREQTFFCHLECMRSLAGIHKDNFYIAKPDFATIGELERG